MANGIPSRRSHRSASTSRTDSDRSKSATAARARSVKRVTASSVSSGGTVHTISPGTRRASRLVASSRTPGAELSSSTASSAAASITCSQLSSTTKVRLSASAPLIRSTLLTAANPGCPAVSDIDSPRAPATVGTDPVTGRRAVGATNHTPSGNDALRPAATSHANRVFPDPPAPTSVTRRFVVSNSETPATSRCRPTKLVNDGRRFVGGPEPFSVSRTTTRDRGASSSDGS